MAIARSHVEGIYIIREDGCDWIVNDDGAAYRTGQPRNQLPELLEIVQRILAERQTE